VNLYGFVSNDGVGKWDLLGLSVAVPVYIREMGSLFTSEGSTFHAFLEYYGESAGFNPVDSWFGHGRIDVPDMFGDNQAIGWDVDSKRTHQLYIQNCCIDIDKFKQNLINSLRIMKNSVDLIYAVGLFDCRDFPKLAVSSAIEKSRREDASWWCNFTKEEYYWALISERGYINIRN